MASIWSVAATRPYASFGAALPRYSMLPAARAPFEPMAEEKRMRSGIVEVKSPARGDVFQANQAANAKIIPALLEIRQRALQGDVSATDYNIAGPPELIAHCAAYELAFVRAGADPDYANFTDGRDSVLSTMSVFSKFNMVSREDLAANRFQCVGVCDTEINNNDPRDQGSRGVSVTVHGVRTIMLTGPSHVVPGDILVWLPPITTRDRDGQKMPMYQRPVAKQALYPTVMKISMSASDYSFAEMWLRKAAEGHAVSDQFAQHESYPNMEKFVETLSGADIEFAAVFANAGKADFPQHFRTLCETLGKSPVFQGTIRNAASYANTFLQRRGVPTDKTDVAMVWRAVIYFVARLAGAHTDYMMSHVIGRALDSGRPGDSIRILKF